MAATTISTRSAPSRINETSVRRVALHAGGVILVAVMAYLVLMPLYRLQVMAFADDFGGYRRAYGNPNFFNTLKSTVGLAIGSLVIALVLGTLLAWAATSLPRRWRLLRVLPILPVVVPAVASVIGWSFLLSPGPGYLNALLRMLPWWSDLTKGPVDIYTLPWIVIITGLGLTAFVYLFVSAGFSNINTELLEAAEVSGSNRIGTFFRVTLPLLRPVLIYGGGVALLLGLGQFTGPLLLGRTAGISVITTDMYLAVSQNPTDYGQAAAIGSPLLLLGVVIVVMQKVVLGDQTRFVTHGGKAFKAPTRTSKSAVFGIITYFVLATVLPVGALVIVSLSNFWSKNIKVDQFTLDNFRKIFAESGITSAIVNSLVCSLAAVLISIPLGFLTATLLLRGRKHRVVRPMTDFVTAMPLGVPAVVFGVGFLLAYTQGPFVLYGTPWVIILVYVTLMLPFTTRMQLSGMVALGNHYLEASRASGASAFRTNTRIVLPLLRPTLGGAAALMFVLLTHEFAASLLVRSAKAQTMGSVLFDYYVNGSYPLVAAIALVMTGITAIGVTIAVILGGADVFDNL